uniref:Uncharacterized protein n=1 Tax=Anolis carolinensis TaxID=28377 RepID=A0A803TU74_ANOCA
PHFYYIHIGRYWPMLQGPEADVGDGEVVVIADVLATGLLRVAGEGGLLVTPDALGRHHQHHDAEDEDHGKPDAPDGRGMAVHSDHDSVEALPLHGASGLERKGRGEVLVKDQ